MTEETENTHKQEAGKKYSMVNPYELFDKLERYPAEIFKQVFLLLKKYDQYIAENETTEGFDISDEPWEVQIAFDYNKDFIEKGCMKWMKKAAVARENGKRGGRPSKDVEKRKVSKEDVAEKSVNASALPLFSDKKSACTDIKAAKDTSNFKNLQKPNRFFLKKRNPVGHNVYMYKGFNVSSCSNVDRDIGGVGEKGEGCITCGQVVEIFKGGGKAAVWDLLKKNGSSHAVVPDG